MARSKAGRLSPWWAGARTLSASGRGAYNAWAAKVGRRWATPSGIEPINRQRHGPLKHHGMDGCLSPARRFCLWLFRRTCRKVKATMGVTPATMRLSGRWRCGGALVCLYFAFRFLWAMLRRGGEATRSEDENRKGHRGRSRAGGVAGAPRVSLVFACGDVRMPSHSQCRTI
jgi:hypothetical protein